MKKKILIYSGLSCILTLSMLPVNASAENKQNGARPYQVTQLISDKAVAENDLGIQVVLLQTYALTILKQPVVNINSMPTLTTHVQNAKKTANTWINTYQPKFQSLNQRVIALNEDMESYYDTLVYLSDDLQSNQQANVDFIRGISYLQKSIEKLQQSIQDTIQSTSDFIVQASAESTAFSKDAKKAISQLSTSDQEAQMKIMMLRNQIYTNRDFIVKAELQRMKDCILLVQSGTSLTDLAKTFTTIVTDITQTIEVKNKAEEIINL